MEKEKRGQGSGGFSKVGATCMKQKKMNTRQFLRVRKIQCFRVGDQFFQMLLRCRLRISDMES